MKILLLDLDAPLMSFGAPIIDQRGVIQDWMGLSQLTGMLANALGWERREAARHADLQARLCYATRRDRAGQRLRDYQTVDLGQPHLDAKTRGWTTLGRLAERKGAFSTGTHIRYRDYHADARFRIALTLVPGGDPTIDGLEAALLRPARPLFLGRKPCLPSRRLLSGAVEAESPLAALQALPAEAKADAVRPIWFTAADCAEVPADAQWLTNTIDTRDWQNQIHGDERAIFQVLHGGADV